MMAREGRLLATATWTWGRHLAPLPDDDEGLLQRMREEFDYFCFIPNPMDIRESLVEKLRKGAYTAELVQVGLPETYTNFNVKVVGIHACSLFPTDACDYMAVNCSVTAKRRNGIEFGPYAWTQPQTTPALFGVSLSSPGSVYELVSGLTPDRPPECMFMCGCEFAFSTTRDEVCIVDVRRDYTTNHVQTLTYSPNDGGDPEQDCFYATVLSTTHAAGEWIKYSGGSLTVVWDRATGQCIREIPDSRLFTRGWGSRLISHDFCVVRERGGCTAYDFTKPAVPGARVCEDIDEIERPELQFSGDTLFRFEQSSDGFGSVSVYSLRTDGKVKELTLSSPVGYLELGDSRIVGETIILPRKNGIRCVDLSTGEVRSVRVGLCERFCDVYFSADGRRMVAFRPRSGVHCLGDFSVYHL